MTAYHMSKEEKEYLKQYDISQFDRPSIATDIAVFSIMGRSGDEKQSRNTDNYRKLPEKQLKILLIRRASYPYKDCWALPGGFCKKEEEVYETARRELYEETNIKNAYLNLAGIFGEPDRDPRGWIISHTFLALIDGEKYSLRAGTDAWEARWFDVAIEKQEIKKLCQADTAVIENEYCLHLTNAETLTELTASIREYKEFKDYHETIKYEISDNQGFAFDHAKLIVYALLSLRSQAENDGKIVFDLMPDAFTLTELQKAFEIILDTKLLTANFRRKIGEYVTETDKLVEGAGHRPARLFQRNLATFYK